MTLPTVTLIQCDLDARKSNAIITTFNKCPASMVFPSVIIVCISNCIDKFINN